MKIFYRFNDRIVYKALSFIIFFIWFIFALHLSIENIFHLRYAWHKFYGKTEVERMQLVTQDMFPTIVMCQKFVPEDAKILIISSPIDFFRLEYYLYPRLIYWQPEDKDIKDLIPICKEKGINYYIVYDKQKRPVLERIN